MRLSDMGAILALGGISLGAYYLYDAYLRGTWPFERTCAEGARYCGSDGYYYECVKGTWTKTAVPCTSGTSECIGDAKLYTPCWDGSLVVTKTCENGKWVSTGNTCPPAPTTLNSVTFVIQSYETLTPLSGVSVELEGYGTKVTGSDGKATFSRVPPGPYKLWCKKEGWHTEDYTHFLEDYIYVELQSSWVGKDINYPRFIKMVPSLPSKIGWAWVVNSPVTLSPDFLTVYFRHDNCALTDMVATSAWKHPTLEFSAEVVDQWGKPFVCRTIVVLSAALTQRVGFTEALPGKHVLCQQSLVTWETSTVRGFVVSLKGESYTEPLRVMVEYYDPRDMKTKWFVWDGPVVVSTGKASFPLCGTLTYYTCDLMLDNRYWGGHHNPSYVDCPFQ